METTITRPVNEIPADDKRTLEGLLGTVLETNQQVFISAYTPGAVPSEEAKANAGHGIEQILSANQAFAKDHGITSSAADEAIAEAMRQTRRRA